MNADTETDQAEAGDTPVEAGADEGVEHVSESDAPEAVDGDGHGAADPPDDKADERDASSGTAQAEADDDVADDGDDSTGPVAADGDAATDVDTGVDDVADDGTVAVFDAVVRERDDYLDALRRVQAEFENYRKQALKRQGDAIEHATGRLVEELLPVLDACEAGIEHGDEGVTAVFTSLLGVLERVGLERIDPLNATFDPNDHEAVMHEPADDDAEADAEPVVVEVMRPGYRWKERTLRAAMVKVKG
ncbi:MAG: nucleotide exchange factor GrpE [Actinobacteria bacterium]|nr:nucleotide exchange factor GrpE [Actinomycetota bacterium]